MHYGGIDEAGYGPMLGPLCVGNAVFEAESSPGSRPCLWAKLKRAVTRAGRDRARRIAIDDSKKLKGARNGVAHPLMQLERGVLAMLAAQDDDRTWLESCTDVILLDKLGVTLPGEPWFGGEPIDVPLGNDARALRLDAKVLRSAMEDTNVQLTRLQVRALSVQYYNNRVEASGSKSWVNFETAATLIDAAWTQSSNMHMVMDRHGGRSCYQRELRTSWPEATIEVRGESEDRSDYLLKRGDASLHLHVRAKADANHLPVALASMAAKLVRELMMLRLNRFFGELMPDLEPTAGYVQDGRRWLEAVAPMIEAQGFDRQTIVRCR
jgi:ribonuclease HII